MKKLKFKEPYNHHYEYADDIQRIVKIFADRGYEISDSDAVRAWEMLSKNDWAAGWMTLYESDDMIFEDCLKYFE